MSSINKIPDQTGCLILHESGAIISSSGDLENDERVAEIIYSMVSLTDNLDPVAFPKGGFNKITVCFSGFCYVICLSNKKIHVVKRTLSVSKKQPNVVTEPNLIDLEPQVNNSING